MALLSKQAWRIITDPHSQLARIYKAKYFLQGTFWNAHLGPKPSYTWKSLLQVRDIMTNTLDWDIGDGRSIHTWDHRWVPYTWSKKPYTTGPRTTTRHTLSDFIDLDIRTWDITALKAHCLPIDV
ncbi:hypothetical protein LIER_08088 [Lithospermum erythrorhizon]|uniref:Uncharacterized protein n=1 Tax=Lithospermum erythrorhizon TaxID=34254 RepID=A0AAV3PCA0_LITER